MFKWCLGVALASMLLLLSGQLQAGARTMAGNGTGAKTGAAVTTTAASISAATVVPFEQTCSCGVDCGSGTCTFHCQGSLGACASCIIGCCSGERERECGGLLTLVPHSRLLQQFPPPA